MASPTQWTQFEQALEDGEGQGSLMCYSPWCHKEPDMTDWTTTTKHGKQPKCSLTEEWIKKMWHIYTMEYYSAIKKDEVMLLQQHGGPREYHTE